jgi:hypothetical protein
MRWQFPQFAGHIAFHPQRELHVQLIGRWLYEWLVAVDVVSGLEGTQTG